MPRRRAVAAREWRIIRVSLPGAERVPPDTLRDLFFASPPAVRLLFNFGILLAQKLATKTPVGPAAS